MAFYLYDFTQFHCIAAVAAKFTRRPAGRPITAPLSRWQLVDIPKYNQHSCRLASVPFSSVHGFRYIIIQVGIPASRSGAEKFYGKRVSR